MDKRFKTPLLILLWIVVITTAFPLVYGLFAMLYVFFTTP